MCSLSWGVGPQSHLYAMSVRAGVAQCQVRCLAFAGQTVVASVVGRHTAILTGAQEWYEWRRVGWSLDLGVRRRTGVHSPGELGSSSEGDATSHGGHDKLQHSAGLVDTRELSGDQRTTTATTHDGAAGNHLSHAPSSAMHAHEHST